MAFPIEITIATAFSAGNLVLLSVLTVVWLQNYKKFRTSLILGLLIFSVVFLVENIVVVYFFFVESMLYGYDPVVHQVMLVVRGLQFLALLSLVYVTLK